MAQYENNPKLVQQNYSLTVFKNENEFKLLTLFEPGSKTVYMKP
jgi:hypothetical protein